jgi:septal ring factor EnvC (AmiA/AmiB activator)
MRWQLSLILLIWTTCAYPVDSVATLEKLRQLDARIAVLQQQMFSTRTEYGNLLSQLRSQEENIGEVAERLEILHGALNDKQNTLADLQDKRKKQYGFLQTQRQVLAQQLRATYMMGHQNYLKLWLNQEDPFTIGRILTYYEYFNRAYARQIAIIQDTLQRLQTLEQSINLESGQLKQIVTSENGKQEQLKLKFQERQAVLAQLANTLENQEKELNRLLEDKHQLETLLGTLEEAVKDIPQPPGEQVVFANLKGQLIHPVSGQILNQFGQHLIGSLTWQGMLMGAKMGDKVRAVAAGRVVFAQWFRNLGLLLIIDHGKGYMTLYAHNQILYKKTGEWLKAGEVIASVGNSGGRKIPALYFEIRYQGTPVDPGKWLRH